MFYMRTGEKEGREGEEHKKRREGEREGMEREINIEGEEREGENIEG